MTYYVNGPIISIFIVRDLFILYLFLPGQNIYSFSCMCFVLILVLISSSFPFCGYFCIILPVIWFIHIGELTLWSSFSYSRQLHHIIIFVPVFFLPSPTDPFLGECFAFSILKRVKYYVKLLQYANYIKLRKLYRYGTCCSCGEIL